MQRNEIQAWRSRAPKASSPLVQDWREDFGVFVRHGVASLRWQASSVTVQPNTVASIACSSGSSRYDPSQREKHTTEVAGRLLAWNFIPPSSSPP